MKIIWKSVISSGIKQTGCPKCQNKCAWCDLLYRRSRVMSSVTIRQQRCSEREKTPWMHCTELSDVSSPPPVIPLNEALLLRVSASVLTDPPPQQHCSRTAPAPPYSSHTVTKDHWIQTNACSKLVKKNKLKKKIKHL